MIYYNSVIILFCQVSYWTNITKTRLRLTKKIVKNKNKQIFHNNTYYSVIILYQIRQSLFIISF